MPEIAVETRGATLSGDDEGEGTPVVLLHGLTATRRYVVMGSKSLQRSGHRVIAYDARGHGHSSPGDGYTYADLATDLGALMDDQGIESAVLVGASMGAHTAIRFALDAPDRVRALVIATPAFDPDAPRDFERWDRLSEGLRTGGVEGFIEAYGEPEVPEKWMDTVRRVLSQRLSAHEHPEAVADALQQVPRSRPFESWAELAQISAPALVVASRDEADPGHPLAIGERYAEVIPGARIVTEEPGSSPIAWQGGQFSKLIAEVAASVG